MRIFLSIMLALIVTAGLLAASWLSAEPVENEDGNRKRKIGAVNTSVAISLGVMVGLINFFIPWFAPGTIIAFLAPVSLILMIGFIACLMVGWGRTGKSWKAMLVLIGLVIITYLTTKATAIMTAALVIASVFFASLIMVLPELVSIAANGFFISRLFYNRYKEKVAAAEGNEKVGLVDRIVAIAVAILAAVAILVVSITQIKWSKIPTAAARANNIAEAQQQLVEAQQEDAYADAEAADVVDDSVVVVDSAAADVTVSDNMAMPIVAATWYKFYHYETLKNESLLDDFDFGLSGFYDGADVNAVMAEHLKRIEEDPALGAATFADFDVRLGTDFMVPGEHYDQNWSDGYWTTKINQCAVAYAADQNYYGQLVQRWEIFVLTYAKPSLVYAENVKDQMYMITLTSQNEWEAPEVIIAETDQPSGHILTYAFLIKGNEFDVTFRSDCGFQPTNVAEVMKETPQPNPVVAANPNLPKSDPKPSGGNGDPQPSGGDPTPSGGGDPTPTPAPTPTPTPAPTPTKEPSQDPVNQGNANKGGGQNKSDDGPGEIQPVDPRTETPTGPQNDNNHGYSDPATVTPSDPPVVEEHKSEPVVTDSNPMTYEPDPVTDRGPADPSIQPTSSGGDGAFTPLD